MWAWQGAPAPCFSGASRRTAISWVVRSTEVRLTQGIQNREQFLVSGFIEEFAPAATLDAHARGVKLIVVPVEGEPGDRGRPTSPGCGHDEPDAERLQVHPARDHRHVRSAPARTGCSSRSRTMRRTAGWRHQRAVSPVRAAQRRIEPASAWASPSADGPSKPTMAGSMRATCLVWDVSSRSICLDCRFRLWLSLRRFSRSAAKYSGMPAAPVLRSWIRAAC